MGHDDPPDAPVRGYATKPGTTASYDVVINPGNLRTAMGEVAPELQGKNARELVSLLLEKTVYAVSWGQIPNADEIRSELTQFVSTHAEAVAHMRQGTLHDFVQRVLAAAEIGDRAAEATTTQARVREN